MADLVEYKLVTEGLSLHERAQTLREVVGLVAAQAHTYETDLPWNGYDRWPAAVQEAADHLLRASGRRPHATGAYAQTGVMHRQAGDDTTWAAFATFAGYAFDASVWDEHARNLVSLADEGTSAIFRLSAAQTEHAATLVAPGELVPLATWRTRQSALRRGWTRLWRREQR